MLYFYPKDNTPGCTTEAMQFRDRYKDFVKAGAVRVRRLARQHGVARQIQGQNLELPFDLIADTEEKLCHMFGVVKNKIMYGKKVKGIERSTFLIDANGVLRAEWRGLKVAGHVDEVLKAVKALKKARLKPRCRAVRRHDAAPHDTCSREQRFTPLRRQSRTADCAAFLFCQASPTTACHCPSRPPPKPPCCPPPTTKPRPLPAPGRALAAAQRRPELRNVALNLPAAPPSAASPRRPSAGPAHAAASAGRRGPSARASRAAPARPRCSCSTPTC